MTEPSTSAVELAVQQRIQAARIRVAAAQQRRDELSAARRRGLAARHARKLKALAEAEQRARQQRLDDGQDDEGAGQTKASIDASVPQHDEKRSSETASIEAVSPDDEQPDVPEDGGGLDDEPDGQDHDDS